VCIGWFRHEILFNLKKNDEYQVSYVRMDGMIFFFFEIIDSEVNPLQEGKHKKKKRNG
jgi:hypothetical protein